MSNLDVWDPQAEYIILDDIEWEYLPSKKPFFGAQREFTLTDKYRKKRKVLWGKPCIYLFNPDADPMPKLQGAERSWYEGNTVLIRLNGNLY